MGVEHWKEERLLFRQAQYWREKRLVFRRISILSLIAVTSTVVWGVLLYDSVLHRDSSVEQGQKEHESPRFDDSGAIIRHHEQPPSTPGEPSGPDSLQVYAFYVSCGSLMVATLGFGVSTYYAARADQRSREAEERAREEHRWQKETREAETSAVRADSQE